MGLEDKKEKLEHDMCKCQTKIEKMREKDSKELQMIKETLKNLKEHSEDMDYELIRLAKAKDRKRKNLRYEVEDMDLQIHNMKNSESEKKKEIQTYNKELQQIKDKNDVQLQKLADDLKFYETEMKKTRFVYENYEREVIRWRQEVKDAEEGKIQFLQVPGAHKTRRSRSNSR